MPYLPSMADLRASPERPRVHHNGFIQLDLDARHRLHVWHPMLMIRQRTYNPVHDHAFDFQSFVFSGRLVHVVYSIEPGVFGTHCIWQPESVPGLPDKYVQESTPVQLICQSALAFQPGEGYTFEAFKFHESLANEPTLTIIRKEFEFEGSAAGASVLVPLGIEPDCEFKRSGHDEALLWELIKEAHPS